MESMEFRLGNLVFKEDCVHPVSFYDFYDGGADFVLYDYKPIPLTEDWMLRFGAEKEIYEEGSDEYYLIIRRDKFSIIWESDDNVYCDISENVFKLKYVHTMQNMYYALEGEELKLNKHE